MADITIKKKTGLSTTEPLYPTTTWTQVENKPTTFTPTSHTHVAADITDLKSVLKWTYVYGKAESAITKGQAVQFAGVQGDHILVKPAVPSEINANPDYFIGVAETSASTNDFLYIVDKGEVIDVNTNAYAPATILWFDSVGSTPGAYTTTEPTNGYAKIQVGAVTKQNATEGIILVRVNFFGVDIADIKATGTPSNTTYLRGDGTWATVSGGGGDFLPLTGGTLTGTISISNTSNKAISVQSATDNQAYFGTFSDYALIGVNRNPSTGTFADNNKASADFGLLGANGDSAIIFGTTTTNAGLPSERMRITGAGNVGIGTTSPTDKLHIDVVTGGGDIIVKSGTAIAKLGASQDTPGIYFGSRSNNKLFLQTNNSTRMTVDTSGDVGIGTTSPLDKLHIAKDGSTQLTLSGASDTNKQLYFGYNTSTDVSVIQSVHQQVAYRTLALNPNGGNVGIGTTSPLTKLQVSGSGWIGNSADGTPGAQTGILFVGGVQNGSELWYSASIRTTNVQGTPQYWLPRLGFFTQNTNTYLSNDQTERMSIVAESGNVGIGTTSPGYKLDVSGVINSNGLLVSGKDATDGAIRAQLNAGNYTAIRFFEGTTANGVIHSFSPTWGNNTLGNSSGAVNINGELGTTIGDWNNPIITVTNSGRTVALSGTSNIIKESGANRTTADFNLSGTVLTITVS